MENICRVGFVCLHFRRSENKQRDPIHPALLHTPTLPLELSLTLRIDEFSSAWSAKCKILCNTFLFNLGRNQSLHTNALLRGLYVGGS